MKITFCCNSIISQPLSNFKTEFSQKEENGGYDNIALNHRYMVCFSIVMACLLALLTYPILVKMTVFARRIIGNPLFSTISCLQPFERHHPTLNLSIPLCCLSFSVFFCVPFLRTLYPALYKIFFACLRAVKSKILWVQ